MKTTPVSLDLWHYSPPQHPPKCKMQHKTAYTHLVTPRRYWWPIITTKVSSLAAWKHVVVFTMIYLHATAWLSAPVRQTHDFIEHNHQEDLVEETRIPTPYIVGFYSAWKHNRWALRSNPGSRSSDPVHTWHVHQIPTRLKYIAKVYSLIQTREKSTHAPSPTQVSSKETLGVPMPYLICCVSSIFWRQQQLRSILYVHSLTCFGEVYNLLPLLYNTPNAPLTIP